MEILRDLGFSASEVQVYVSLLTLGPSTAGPIVRATNLNNSVVHATLNKLLRRGVISFVRRGKVRRFQATDPRNLLNWLDGKRRSLEEIMPELLAKQQNETRDEAEVFEGIRGFKAMCYKLIENAQPGDIYRFFAFVTQDDDLDREIYTFYREFTQDRLRRGIVIRGIADYRRKKLFRQLGYELGSIRFVKIPAISNLSIFQDRVVMTPWESRPVSFLIQSQQMAEGFRRYFDTLWTRHSASR